jgi:hypothetical protein
MSEPLKEAFHEAMIAVYTRTFSACGYRAGRFLELVKRHGGLETAKMLLREEEPRGGFVALHEQGRLDVTMEAVIVENQKWHPLFTQEEIETAKKRLSDFGYEPRKAEA